MIDRDHGLSLSRQADLLELSRGCSTTFRFQFGSDIELMTRDRSLHTDYPFWAPGCCAIG